MVNLGAKTKWGKVAAIVFRDGERYYMMAKVGAVALMPADVIEVGG